MHIISNIGTCGSGALACDLACDKHPKLLLAGKRSLSTCHCMQVPLAHFPFGSAKMPDVCSHYLVSRVGTPYHVHARGKGEGTSAYAVTFSLLLFCIPVLFSSLFSFFCILILTFVQLTLVTKSSYYPSIPDFSSARNLITLACLLCQLIDTTTTTKSKRVPQNPESKQASPT